MDVLFWVVVAMPPVISVYAVVLAAVSEATRKKRLTAIAQSSWTDSSITISVERGVQTADADVTKFAVEQLLQRIQEAWDPNVTDRVNYVLDEERDDEDAPPASVQRLNRVIAQ